MDADTPLVIVERAGLRLELACLRVEQREVLGAWKSRSGRVALDAINELLTSDSAPLEDLRVWVGRCTALARSE